MSDSSGGATGPVGEPADGVTGTTDTAPLAPRDDAGAQGRPAAPHARNDDPSARAVADVTFLLARAAGLRRIVELVEENGLNPAVAARDDE